MNDDVVIVAAARTPMGALQGALSKLPAAQLGGQAIAAVIERVGNTKLPIDEVLMGCVLPAGQGQAPARQAALAAGLSLATPATTINKMCGSGMQAVMLGCDMIKAGSAQTIIAGGMESMTNAPYLLLGARGGYRLGHGTLVDHMFLDGLEDAYQRGSLMGSFAEQCARQYQFSRTAQDEFALRSLERALQAGKNTGFDWEIIPVVNNGEVLLAKDEQPTKARPEKIPYLKPAFASDGTVTAANSSSISDGAAALLLMSERQAMQQGLRPLARILGTSRHAQEPALFTTAPVFAIQKLLGKLRLTTKDIDLWEINEAFAVVVMAAMQELALPGNIVNIHGGACALGHPIGASGARIIVGLLGALQQTGGRRGVAAICIGGGEATALAIELI